MPIAFSLLYSFKAKGSREALGRVPDGERLKVEFRGETDAGSEVSGKVRGTDWVLVGPLGSGQFESVQTVLTPEGDRFVIQLQGSSSPVDADAMRIKGAGVIRSRSPRFAHLDGQLALVEGTVRDGDVEVSVYHG
jgi:hypothetical protein